MSSSTAKEILEFMGGKDTAYRGNLNSKILSINTIKNPKADQITFCNRHDEIREQMILETSATVILCPIEIKDVLTKFIGSSRDHHDGCTFQTLC